MTRKTLSPSTQKYLEEVWGYKRVEDVDPLTWECITENAIENAGDPKLPADAELVNARSASDILVVEAHLAALRGAS